jgi:hypothetical protein
MTGAIADCERILGGFWGQPVNSTTSLAFVVAAVVVARRTNRYPVAFALAGVGFGSLVFHGPMPVWGDWAHDVTLGWLLVVVALTSLDRTRFAWPALGLLAVAIALLPAGSDPLAVTGTVFAGGAVLTRRDWRRSVPPLVLLGAAAIFGRLCATNGPLCNPDSLLQGHGLWHIAAAAAVAWWAISTVGPIPREASEPTHSDRTKGMFPE